MLMLEYKTRENEVISFKVQEDKVYQYKYKLEPYALDMTQINITRMNPIKGPASAYDVFHQVFPLNKGQLMKQIGVWVRDQLYNDLGRDIIHSKKDGLDVIYHMIANPSKNKEINKLKSYCFLRSRKIGQVLGGMIWKELLVKHKVTNEQLKEISALAWRIYHKNAGKQGVNEILFNCLTHTKPEVWNIIKSDLSKYNVSLCKYILNDIHMNKGWDMDIERYVSIIKKAPPIVKHCKYGLEFNIDGKNYRLDNLPVPKNRWQYFALRTSLSIHADLTRWPENETTNPVIPFLNKLPYSDIAVWHYFKKARFIKGPYSTREISHLIQTIMDGIRLYNQYKDNLFGVSFVPVTGSPMRMIRNAMYNHRQEQDIQKKRRLSVADFNLPVYYFKLPDWIEKIRIKTAHEMIKAGIECQHCIGSYTNSMDIFVREGDVCLQIGHRDLNIMQCFDIGDRITDKSNDFKKRVDKALQPIREEQTKEVAVK